MTEKRGRVTRSSVRKQYTLLNINTPVEVIPFSVFEPSLVYFDSDPIKPLRICVPGILSQYRRNYLALLDIMERFLSLYKTRFIMDFLGGVQSGNHLNDPGLLILEKMHHLNRDGFSIIVHNVANLFLLWNTTENFLFQILFLAIRMLY